MRRQELLALYDQEYSSIYNRSFLLGENFIECTEFEVELISNLLIDKATWLDVACGTGYFLSRFPNIKRAGLDLSPAMLAVGRESNPDVSFYEYDFREPRTEWLNRWDLVSCMWYAYCYADTVQEIDLLLRNIAAWTSLGGTCFLPVCDPNVLCKTEIPSNPPADSDDGRIDVNGVIWTWTDEPSGRCHQNLLAPTVEYLSHVLSTYFHDVEVLNYPQFKNDCLQSRKALIGRRKLLT